MQEVCFTLSCIDFLLPDLEIDDEFTLDPLSFPIMDDIDVLLTEATLNVVRQKIHYSANDHVSGFQVIIGNVFIYSTSLSLCIFLLECYMRIYFKYKESFKRGKYDFLSECFEFLGRDNMPTGNTTAASKYDLVTD